MHIALITGATGQDGSYLAELLSGRGWEVHALVRSSTAGDEQPVGSNIHAHIGDLTDSAGLASIVADVSPHYVFNLAGVTSVAESWQQPLVTSLVTGHSVATMLDAAWRVQERNGHEVRFVQATSAEIFGSSADSMQSEATLVSPISPYGAAKAYAHHLVGVYRRRGLFAASAILYNHESPRRPRNFVTRKISSGVAAIDAGQTKSLSLGNLSARRDWGWAPDFVDAIYRIATAERADDYIVATGVGHSVEDFVAAAFEAVGILDWERYVVVDPQFDRPVDAAEMVGDSSKIRASLGWTPTISFNETVRRMVEHDRALLGGPS